MRILPVVFLLLFSFTAFAQTDSAFIIPAFDTASVFSLRVNKPCSSERNRAIKDAKNGNLYFFETAIVTPLHTKYMPQVCKSYHLRYFYLSEAKLGYEGFNPLRCYVAAMDSSVKAKYGDSIKARIVAKADSCLWAGVSSDTVEEKYCHIPASLADTSIFKNHFGEFFHIKCDSALYRKFKRLSTPMAEPVMLIGLLVEPDGKITSYKLNCFASEGYIYYDDTVKFSRVYDSCGKYLLPVALRALAKYPVWKPALMENKPVRVWHTVEVVFEKEDNKNGAIEK
jgi:hypothetical protein